MPEKIIQRNEGAVDVVDRDQVERYGAQKRGGNAEQAAG